MSGKPMAMLQSILKRVTRTRQLAQVLIVLIMLLTVGLPRSHADDAIKVANQSTDNKFRQSLTFKITAASAAGNIVAARVLLRDRVSSNTTVYLADAFEQNAQVDLHYTWDTRTEVTPPFQLYRYSWQITDSAGNTVQTPFVEVEMTDDSHPWKSLTDGKVRVYWYGNTDEFGQALLGSAQQGFKHVALATGYTPDGELRVIMYPDQASFQSFFPSVDRVRTEWIGGETFGTLTVQWNDSSHGATSEAYGLKQTVPHELAHAFLYYRMAGRAGRIPSWFNEGQAVNNQIEGIDRALANARKIAQEDRLLRLYSMESHTQQMSEFQDIVDWYDTATSLVAFLYDKYGLSILGKIVDKMNDGAKFDEALKDTTGLTMAEYEKEWRAWLGAPALPDAVLRSTPTMDMPRFPPTPDYSTPSIRN